MTPNDEPRSYARPIEGMARAIIRSRGAGIVADENWPETVKHYRKMCAMYPGYALAHSLINDAFRDAETAWAEMISHGWITPGGLDAMAEEERAK